MSIKFSKGDVIIDRDTGILGVVASAWDNRMRVLLDAGGGREEFHNNPTDRLIHAPGLAPSSEPREAVTTPVKTLRDEFATAALTGLLGRGITVPQCVADAAYDIADAMLARREEGK